MRGCTSARHLTFRKESSHLEVTSGESDDGSLVELVGDGGRQWQQLGQFKELSILLLAACSCCVLGLLFHRAAAAAHMIATSSTFEVLQMFFTDVV